ncbi:unnamed protein product [Merluccius merluccius]
MSALSVATTTSKRAQVKNNSGVTPAGQCGAWVKEPGGGAFTSPNYPEKYPADRECVYIIEVHRPVLRGALLHRAVLGSVKFDHIEVRDGPFGFSPIIGRYCGQESPSYVPLPPDATLYIKFVADGELEAIGFSARYNFTQASSSSLAGYPAASPGRQPPSASPPPPSRTPPPPSARTPPPPSARRPSPPRRAAPERRGSPEAAVGPDAGGRPQIKPEERRPGLGGGEGPPGPPGFRDAPRPGVGAGAWKTEGAGPGGGAGGGGGGGYGGGGLALGSAGQSPSGSSLSVSSPSPFSPLSSGSAPDVWPGKPLRPAETDRDASVPGGPGNAERGEEEKPRSSSPSLGRNTDPTGKNPSMDSLSFPNADHPLRGPSVLPDGRAPPAGRGAESRGAESPAGGCRSGAEAPAAGGRGAARDLPQRSTVRRAMSDCSHLAVPGPLAESYPAPGNGSAANSPGVPPGVPRPHPPHGAVRRSLTVSDERAAGGVSVTMASTMSFRLTAAPSVPSSPPPRRHDDGGCETGVLLPVPPSVVPPVGGFHGNGPSVAVKADNKDKQEKDKQEKEKQEIQDKSLKSEKILKEEEVKAEKILKEEEGKVEKSLLDKNEKSGEKVDKPEKTDKDEKEDEKKTGEKKGEKGEKGGKAVAKSPTAAKGPPSPNGKNKRN